MDYIEEYFKEKAKNVNFIELKDYSLLNLGMGNDIVLPLPLVSDVLADGITTGKIGEEVTAEMILDGMIYLIGTDQDFEFRDQYIKILKSYSEKIDDYIFFKGIQYLEEDEFERSEIYFRALKHIEPKHVLGVFNYALALERIGQRFLNEDKPLPAKEFIDESTYQFETVLDIDENYPLAYYKLGYHYNYNGRYLKAKLMWEKYINLDDDELRIQEVREQIDYIEDEVTMESGLTYLSYNRHEEALEQFLKMLPRHEEWWELRYLIGNTYAGMNQSDLAIGEYFEALKLNNQVEDVYNELGIELFKVGDFDKAIEVYSKGIENLEASYKLYFNRGLAFLQTGKKDLGYKDISKAYELNPVDENVKEMMKEINKDI